MGRRIADRSGTHRVAGGLQRGGIQLGGNDVEFDCRTVDPFDPHGDRAVIRMDCRPPGREIGDRPVVRLLDQLRRVHRTPSRVDSASTSPPPNLRFVATRPPVRMPAGHQVRNARRSARCRRRTGPAPRPIPGGDRSPGLPSSSTGGRYVGMGRWYRPTVRGGPPGFTCGLLDSVLIVSSPAVQHVGYHGIQVERVVDMTTSATVARLGSAPPRRFDMSSQSTRRRWLAVSARRAGTSGSAREAPQWAVRCRMASAQAGPQYWPPRR